MRVISHSALVNTPFHIMSYDRVQT